MMAVERGKRKQSGGATMSKKKQTQRSGIKIKFRSRKQAHNAIPSPPDLLPIPSVNKRSRRSVDQPPTLVAQTTMAVVDRDDAPSRSPVIDPPKLSRVVQPPTKTRRGRPVSSPAQQQSTSRQSPQKKRQLPRRSTRYDPKQQQQKQQQSSPMQHWQFMSAAGLPHPSSGIFPSTPPGASPFYQHTTTGSYMGVPAVFQGHVFLPQPFFGMPISGAPMGPPTYAGIVPNIGYPTLSTDDYARIVAPNKDVTISDNYPLLPSTKAKQISEPTPPPPTKSKPPKLSSTSKSASAAAVDGGCKRKALSNAPVVFPNTVTDWARLPAGKELIGDRSADGESVAPIELTTRTRPSVESAISRLINKNKQQQRDLATTCPAPNATAATSLSNVSPPDSASLKRKQQAPRKRGGVPLLKPADVSITNSDSIITSPSPKCELFEPLEKMPKLELQTSTELIPVCKVKTVPGRKGRKAVKIVSNWKPVGVGLKRFVYLNNDTKPAKRVCYTSAKHKREPETIREGDCVVINSGDEAVDGHIGKVTRIFVDPDTDQLMLSLFWFYRAEQLELEMSMTPPMARRELLASRHIDVVAADAVNDIAFVITYNEFCRYVAENVLDMTRPALPEDKELWPRGDESYTRRDRMPREDTPGELVFFCRRVYDFKGKRVVRNRS